MVWVLMVLALLISLLASAGPPQWRLEQVDEARFYAPRDPRAPQAADPKALFRLAPEKAQGPVDQGILVCRATASCEHDWDAFADPDLLITITLPGQAPVAIYSGESSCTAHVSIPGVSLKRGERITVKVEDRDVTTNELVGAGTETFDDHLPLRFSSELMKTECRVVSADAAAKAAAPWLDQVRHAAADVVRSTRADLNANDGGESSFRAPLAKLSDALLRAAPLTTWEHPALVTAIRDAEGALKTWQAQLAAAIAKTEGSPAVVVDGWRWEASSGGLLRVTNVGKKPARLDPEAVTLRLAFANGVVRTALVALTNYPRFEKKLAPGEFLDVEVTAVCNWEHPFCPEPEGPRLLRVNRSQWLKLDVQ